MDFITNIGLYYYSVMLLSLKNVGATYEWLINKIYVALIGRTMEVYVDKMIIKSVKETNHGK